MKYLIVGFHSSGKREIVRDLESNGVNVGKVFTSVSDNDVREAYCDNMVRYENTDVLEIFDTQAYLFVSEITDYSMPFYEGLALYDYENSDVFVLEPNHLISVPSFGKEICIIWVDGSNNDRHKRYSADRRDYDWQKRENIERNFCDEFIDKIYGTPNSHVVYFNNEDPLRVSAVVQTLVKHPDMIETFEKRYV